MKRLWSPLASSPSFRHPPHSPSQLLPLLRQLPPQSYRFQFAAGHCANDVACWVQNQTSCCGCRSPSPPHRANWTTCCSSPRTSAVSTSKCTPPFCSRFWIRRRHCRRRHCQSLPTLPSQLPPLLRRPPSILDRWSCWSPSQVLRAVGFPFPIGPRD